MKKLLCSALAFAFLIGLNSCKSNKENKAPLGDPSIGDVGIDDAATILDANGVPQPQQRTTFLATYKASNKTPNSVIVDIRGIQPVYRDADTKLRFFAQLLYAARGSKYANFPGGQREYRTTAIDFNFNQDTIAFDRINTPNAVRLLASVSFNGDDNRGLEEFITRDEAGANASPDNAYLIEPFRIQIGMIYPNGQRVLLFGLPTQVSINVNKE